MAEEFEKWFSEISGHSAPRPWQADMARQELCRSRLIRIPTGLGKTEGILAAWSYHRVLKQDKNWPNRLVWCLPMRVLVEQTAEAARKLMEKMPSERRPAINIAMGGEDIGEWFLHPERPAIIVGTQDMLLSRALNRGYASSRARWPMEFGLLSQDALWVMDEVQLMDVGLATSAQLQSFRDEDGSKSLRRCHTWWMSATLQQEWLRSVDSAESHKNWVRDPINVPTDQQSGGLWDISKTVKTAEIPTDEIFSFSKRILDEHNSIADGEFGKITLVVCNTVKRANETFDALRKAGRKNGLELVHSRFRPAEREEWRERFLSRATCKTGVDLIIVATQVVEAGVDISAGCLITELAPWPSLVQRFGRCARYGGTGSVLVVDRGRDGKQTAPYNPNELESAWDALKTIPDVGIKHLEAFETSLRAEEKKLLYPYEPSHLLLRKEYDELFDTTPDLTGADLDISRFIRSGEERDLQVFWQEIESDRKGKSPNKPDESKQPHRRELCAVPFLEARDWLCEKNKSKLRSGKRAWVWDWLDGQWVAATREALFPGRIVCVSADSGGYVADRGFNAESNATVSLISSLPIDPDAICLEQAEDQNDGEIPGGHWKTIACHTAEVAQRVKEISREVGLSEVFQNLLELAAFWHDWGKAHPAFQNMLRRKRHDAETFGTALLAKSKLTSPPIRPRYFAGENETDERAGFRHELASALGLFGILKAYAPKHEALLGPWADALAMIGRKVSFDATHQHATPLVERLLRCTAEEFNLVAYLVASHHGKVRLALHASPKDQDYRDRDGRGLPIAGVREGDRLPPVSLRQGESAIPEIPLTMSPAALGLSEKTGASWRERCIGLVHRHGAASLALLEAVMRAADVRASRLNTSDPSLGSGSRS